MNRPVKAIVILLAASPMLVALHRVTGPIEDLSGRWSGSQLLYSYADEANDVTAIEEVSDLTEFVAGTTDQVTVTDDGDGTITIAAPQALGETSSPTFAGLTLSGLTATRLLASNGSKALSSTDLNSWITGTANEIAIADDGDGTITVGLVDPLIVAKGGTGAATLTDGGILLGSGTGAVTALGVATNGQIPIGDGTTDPVLATLTGTTNQVTVTNGAGTVTLSTPQDLDTATDFQVQSLTITNGALTLAGTARAWRSWAVKPDAVKLPGANPAAADTIDAFPFQRFDKGTEESVYYMWEVPNDFAVGTGSVRGRFEFVVFNPPTSGGTNVAENVRLGFEYKKISDGALFDFTAGTSSGYMDETIAVDETAEIKHHTENGVCDTTGWAVGDTILFRFYRDATAVEDTYDNEAVGADNDVWVFYYHMGYLVDKLGASS